MYWKNDSYWRAAYEVAVKLRPGEGYILTPQEFIEGGFAFWPIGQAKQLHPGEVTAFVIQKDDVVRMPLWLLRGSAFRQFHCVWANEVFVAYSAHDENCTEAGGFEEHIASFLEKRQAFLEQFEQGDDVQTPAAKLPYLLDTQDNRILQVQFPHKRYVREQFMDLSNAPRVLKKEVVKYCVSRVHLELSAFCNRSCQYCPVGQLESRKDTEDRIPRELFDQCISDLREINYDGKLLLFLFNEPLASRAFFLEMLDNAKAMLPRCQTEIATNGDYLDAEAFAELIKHPLNGLTVSVHYAGVWNREEQIEKIRTILEKIKIEEMGDWEEGEGRVIFNVAQSAYDSTFLKHFSLRSEDFTIHGTDRGGTVSGNVNRLENLDGCHAVMEQLCIDHTGTVVSCCHICLDASGTETAAYGRVGMDGDIFSIYTNQRAADFRRKLFAPRQNCGELPTVCRTCTIAHVDQKETLYRLDEELRREISGCWLINQDDS